MEGRNGALLTLSYLGAVRAMPSYNVMGLAKAIAGSLGALPRPRPGPTGIRVNGISAGPIKTLAAAGIEVSAMLDHVENHRAAEAQRHHRGRGQRRRLPVLGPGRGHYRRNHLRRRRVQHRRDGGVGVRFSVFRFPFSVFRIRFTVYVTVVTPFYSWKFTVVSSQ